MSLLVISEILGLLVNTLTSNEEYSPHNSENLRQPIQMQLSKKQIISLNFLRHSEIYIKFYTFWKKYGPHNLCIMEIRDCD